MPSPTQNAFPIASQQEGDWFPGLTIRQYYAAAALQGFVANTSMLDWLDRNTRPEQVKEQRLGIVAALCFSYADAMLAHEEREAME